MSWRNNFLFRLKDPLFPTMKNPEYTPLQKNMTIETQWLTKNLSEETMSVRYGPVFLLAGIDLLTGQNHSIISDSHKSSDFIDFLKRINGSSSAEMSVNIILDNHSAHSPQKILNYLVTMPNRFKFTFTPKRIVTELNRIIFLEDGENMFKRT